MPKRVFKYHQLNQSALYNVQSKRKLGKLFNLSPSKIQKLSIREDNYLKYSIKKSGPKERKVQEPKPILKRIHVRLFKLLRKIEPPVYLHSGIKGRSYITNAKSHLNSERLLKLDIQKFYPSTKREHVYCFFRDIMRCSTDVSSILASLCTCDGHVPTGSPVSQLIAYFAHKKMFDDIYYYALERNLMMTVYVDDITISGPKLNNGTMYDIKGIVHKSGLDSHPKKENVYLSNTPKLITGVVACNETIKLPNYKHLEIHNKIQEISQVTDHDLKLKLINKTMGKLVAAVQLEPKLYKSLAYLNNEMNKLKKELNYD